MEKIINPSRPVFLFNDKFPQGEMFTLTKEQEAEKIKEGWFDTPAHLNLPPNMDTGVTVEKAENADPKHLIKILEGYGFIVITQEQLKAEANKMANVAMDPTNLTDEAIIAEAERRGLKDAEEDETGTIGSYAETFELNPKLLTKPELVVYGKSLGLNLKMTMKEATMIARISEELKPE